jgi:hypothetical protein
MLPAGRIEALRHPALPGTALCDVLFHEAAGRPPHSPTPVPVLTVSGAAGAKANSLQSLAGATIRSKAISADECSKFKAQSSNDPAF